jgi:hypothetical protein
MYGGSLFTTEIAIPFLRDSSATLITRLCPTDRSDLSEQTARMSASIARMIGSQLKASPSSASPECGTRSSAAKLGLYVYLRLVRVSSLGG